MIENRICAVLRSKCEAIVTAQVGISHAGSCDSFL